MNLSIKTLYSSKKWMFYHHTYVSQDMLILYTPQYTQYKVYNMEFLNSDNKSKESLEYVDKCCKHDANAPYEHIMQLVDVALQLMVVTPWFPRIGIICGDKVTRPDGLAEYWVIDHLGNGKFDISNEEGLDEFNVDSISHAFTAIKAFLASKVIAEVTFISQSSNGRQKYNILYSSPEMDVE